MAGCTSVDDTLGADFIPSGQKMSSHTVTIELQDGITTSLGQMDSISTNNTGYIFIGSKTTPEFGQTKASAIIQTVPITYHTESYYGYQPVVDSVQLRLYINSYSGNTDAEQLFDIYEVVQDIKRDSAYYASYPLTNDDGPIVGDKLFSFTYKGKGDMHSRLDDPGMITQAGRDYLERLVAADGDEDIPNDSVFVKNFKGLYVVPRQQGDNALYKFQLAYYTNNFSSLVLYFHNHDEDYTGPVTEAGENNLDTLAMIYVLTDGVKYYPTSINKIERDYPAAMKLKIDSGDPVGTAYVEQLAGVYTNLTIQQALIDKIRELKVSEGPGKNLAIHNATVFLELADGYYTPGAMNASFDRLGMFQNYARMSKPIPDYNYQYETTSGSPLPYGGYLNRSDGGYYSMNITTTLQRLLKDPDNYQRSISVTPDVYSVFDMSDTFLKGTAGTGYKVKLKLTYSLIPEK